MMEGSQPVSEPVPSPTAYSDPNNMREAPVQDHSIRAARERPNIHDHALLNSMDLSFVGNGYNQSRISGLAALGLVRPQQQPGAIGFLGSGAGFGSGQNFGVGAPGLMQQYGGMSVGNAYGQQPGNPYAQGNAYGQQPGNPYGQQKPQNPYAPQAPQGYNRP